jgi:hypothetical protein
MPSTTGIIGQQARFDPAVLPYRFQFYLPEFVICQAQSL